MKNIDRRTLLKLLSALSVSPILSNTIVTQAFGKRPSNMGKMEIGNKLSKRMSLLFEHPSPLGMFFRKSSYLRGVHAPNAIDLTFGNPHEKPLPSIIEELRKQLDPKNAKWFAYKRNERPARQAIVDSLRASTTLAFENNDIFLTNGATAGLSMILTTIIDPGDEVIYLNPPWFGYQPLITASGGVPKLVNLDKNFNLDIAAINATITPRTRAIIINSPHNPSGRIFSSGILKKLSSVLSEKSKVQGRPIYLLSDEAYRRIVFDNKPFPSPVSYYPYSFLIYTYGKTLLMPGQRLGYVAIPPSLPDRKLFQRAMGKAQVVTGWCYPNALLQYALPKLEHLSIDLSRLQNRRDFVSKHLNKAGYDVTIPEGTFYILAKSPTNNDFQFTEKLAAKKVFVLPGEVLGAPGYFRITLTATDDMLERAMPVFTELIG